VLAGAGGHLRTHEEAGRTVSLLASDAGPVALFAVADTIKPSSREAVASLKALGITPVMLTGDNQATATPSRTRPASPKRAGTCCPRTSSKRSRRCRPSTARPR
jgi:Cd2+/Zn2+-exporting ATPase